MVRIELTEEEAEIVEGYVFKKAVRLKESGLEDSRCYPALYSAHLKLSAAMAEAKGE